MPNLFTKSVLLTALAGFVVFSIYGVVVHGMLLQGMYSSLPGELWRAEGDELMHWIFIAYALMAWVLSALRPANVTTAAVGFQRGLLLGVFLGAAHFVSYALQPWTLEVTLAAFAADVFMPAVAGLVMAPVAAKFSD